MQYKNSKITKTEKKWTDREREKDIIYLLSAFPTVS